MSFILGSCIVNFVLPLFFSLGCMIVHPFSSPSSGERKKKQTRKIIIYFILDGTIIWYPKFWSRFYVFAIHSAATLLFFYYLWLRQKEKNKKRRCTAIRTEQIFIKSPSTRMQKYIRLKRQVERWDKKHRAQKGKENWIKVKKGRGERKWGQKVVN